MVKKPLLGTGQNGGRSMTRAQIQEALQAWLAILGPADWGFGCTDTETNTFAGLNPAFAAMHGYTVDELIGQPIELLKAPESRPAAQEHRARADELGHHTFEAMHLRKDGSTFPALVSVTSARDDQGELLYRIACVQDISERKRAEQALRDTQQQFYSAFLKGPHPMYIARQSDGCILAANERFLEGVGYAADELTGRTVLELGLVEPAAYAEIRELLSTRDHINDLELRARKRSGAIIDVTVAISEIDAAGEPCYLVISNDITEQKRTAAALDRAQRQFQEAFWNAPHAMQIARKSDLRIIAANGRFLSGTGYTEQEVVGKTLVELGLVPEMPPDDVLRQLEEHGHILDVELRMETPSGNVMDVSVSVSEIDADGEACYLVSASDITERKHHEAALRESEAMFRTLAETLPAAVFIVSKDGVQYANSAAGAITGFTPDELHGQGFLNIIHPEYKDLVRDRALARLRGEDDVPSRYELKVATKGGGEVWVEFAAALIEFRGERAILGTAFDITERKRADAALRESEEKFRTVSETIGAIAYIVDESSVLFVNHEIERILGYTPDEVYGRNFLELFHIDERALAEQLTLAELRGDAVPYRDQLRVVTKSGETRWLEFSGGLIEYQGRPAIAGSAFDITERRRVEEALRESEERYRSLVETALDMIAELDGDRFVYVSPSSKDVLGFEPEELVGRSALDFVDPRDQSQVVEAAIDIAQSDQPGRGVHKMRHKDGELRWLETVGSTFVARDGHHHGVIISRDITERKQAEEALRESEAMNRALLEAMPDMMFRVNREFVYRDFVPAKGLSPFVPPEQFVGRTVADFLPPDVATQAEAAVRRALDTAEAQSLEYSLPTNGARMEYEARVVAIDSDNALTIVRDITERKRAEHALRQSERRFAVAFHASPLAIAIGRREDERLIDVNDRFLELIGYSREEVIGQRATDLNLFVDESEREKAVGAEFSAGATDGVELRIRTKPGNLIDIMTSFARIEIDGERCFLAMTVDITESKRAREALRQSEERYRMLADHANDMIYRYRVGQNAGFEYVSPSVTTLAGYTPEEYYADPDFADKIIHQDDRERFEQAIEEGASGPFELRWLRKDGSVMWGELRNVFIYDNDGEVMALQGIVRDITDRKRAEQELLQARDELESRVEQRMESSPGAYGLTFREMTVLHLVADGISDKEIAAELGISPLTVQKHTSNILRKMNAASRTEAGVRAVREGLLSKD